MQFGNGEQEAPQAGAGQERGQLRAAQRALLRELGLLTARVSELGATTAQCHALIELERLGQASIKDLATELLIDHSSASRLVRRLVQDRLVRMSPSKSDGRKRLLTVSPAGARLLLRAHARANKQAAAAMSLLTAHQRSRVLEGLRLYGDALRRARLAQDQEGHH